MRLTGITAITAGTVNILFNLVGIGVSIPPGVQNTRVFLVLFLLIFAFTGIYARQSHKAGVAGLLGYILAVVSLIMNVCFRFGDLFIGTVLLPNYTEAVQAILAGPYSTALNVTFLLFVIGYVLFGAGMLRARVFSRWAAWLVIIGAVVSYVLMMLPINIGAILVGISLVWIGYQLWSEQAAAMPELRPAIAGD